MITNNEPLFSMKNKTSNPFLAILFFLISALLFVALFLFILGADDQRSRSFSTTLMDLSSFAVLAIAGVGSLRTGIRQLHTKMKGLQPPSAKFGTLRLVVVVLLQMLGVFLFAPAILHIASIRNNGFSLVEILRALALLTVTVICLVAAQKIKKSAFTNGDSTLLGEDI